VLQNRKRRSTSKNVFNSGHAMGKTRFHGSKHGIPASADAAQPQGINDQFSAGPDFRKSDPSEVRQSERR
jgi:hypothetical protein